jgi:hypothetical protein
MIIIVFLVLVLFWYGLYKVSDNIYDWVMAQIERRRYGHR